MLVLNGQFVSLGVIRKTSAFCFHGKVELTFQWEAGNRVLTIRVSSFCKSIIFFLCSYSHYDVRLFFSHVTHLGVGKVSGGKPPPHT